MALTWPFIYQQIEAVTFSTAHIEHDQKRNFGTFGIRFGLSTEIQWEMRKQDLKKDDANRTRDDDAPRAINISSEK